GEKPQNEPIPELKINQLVSRKLSGSETHHFSVSMLAGEYLHVTVQQQGIDVVLTLISGDSKEPIVVDRPNAGYGREGLSFIANSEQKVVLVLKAYGAKANQGSYSITVDARRPSVPQDRKMMAAEREISRAEETRNKETPADLRRAIDGFQRALELWREL